MEILILRDLEELIRHCSRPHAVAASPLPENSQKSNRTAMRVA